MRTPLLFSLALSFCQPPGQLSQDETARAQALIRAHGCWSCHTVPGMAGPAPNTGPPLPGQAEKAYVAGVAPNTLDMLTAFILDPQAIDPRSAMPDLGLSGDEAQLIARYLLDHGGT